jgi:hypothetical protein
MMRSASVTATVALISLTTAACANSPRVVEAETSAEPPAASEIAVHLAEQDGQPRGTLTYGADSRSYSPSGFCREDPDCPSVTDDPRPSPYLSVPRRTTIVFGGSLQPLNARLTLQSHDLSDYQDFGMVEVEIDDGVAALELPNVRPNAFLLDVVAAGHGGVTHFYFGLKTHLPEADP